VGKTYRSTKALGFVKDKLVYMEFEGKSNVSLREPLDTKLPFYQGWEDFIELWKAKAPAGLGSILQSGGFAWVWMPSEKAFVSSAIQGIVIAMLFAFIVLLMATRNIVQATMSLVCVAIIIVWVVGIMVMKGWQLGVSESISVVILIGFSVDYVIHLSADYMHSSF
jgi:protein dispatched 1